MDAFEGLATISICVDNILRTVDKLRRKIGPLKFAFDKSQCCVARNGWGLVQEN